MHLSRLSKLSAFDLSSSDDEEDVSNKPSNTSVPPTISTTNTNIPSTSDTTTSPTAPPDKSRAHRVVYVASRKRKRALEEANLIKIQEEEAEQRLLHEKRNIFIDVKKGMKDGKITLVTDQHAIVDNEIFCSKAVVVPWPPAVGDHVSTAAVPHSRHEYPKKAIRYRLIKRVKKSSDELNQQKEETTNLEEIRKSYLEVQKLTRHNRKLEGEAMRKNKKHKRGKAPDPRQTWSNSDDTSIDHNPLYNKTVSFGSNRGSSSSSLFGRRSGSQISRMEEEDNNSKTKRKVEVHWTNKLLKDMTTRDWRIVREDYDINIRGGNAVNPLRSWLEAGLPDELMRAIQRQGYTDPTPIQRQCVPVGVQSRDLIGLAETGSGKTVAFVLPMLLHLLRCDKKSWAACSSEGPLALVMAPVRELVTQISEQCSKMSYYIEGLSTCAIIGGTSIEKQGYELQQGKQIVVATPGRLIDLIKSRYLVLRQCKYLVLDEGKSNRCILLSLLSLLIFLLLLFFIYIHF
jgi:hypothetical protein